jgi:hypothetical protein
MVKIHYDLEELAWTMQRTGRGRQGDKDFNLWDEIRTVFFIGWSIQSGAKYRLISELSFRQSLF